MAVTADGLPGGLDQFGRSVYAFNGIASAHEFASISACSTAGIKKRCARKDAPLTEPGSDRGALLTDRTVDQQIERPRVLTVKRATRLLGHGSPQNCITTMSARLRYANQSFRLNQGTLYPALVRLEQRGWIKGSWQSTENNRDARYYVITKAGARALADQIDRWQRSAGLVNRLLADEAQ